MGLSPEFQGSNSFSRRVCVSSLVSQIYLIIDKCNLSFFFVLLIFPLHVVSPLLRVVDTIGVAIYDQCLSS